MVRGDFINVRLDGQNEVTPWFSIWDLFGANAYTQGRSFEAFIVDDSASTQSVVLVMDVVPLMADGSHIKLRDGSTDATVTADPWTTMSGTDRFKAVRTNVSPWEHYRVRYKPNRTRPFNIIIPTEFRNTGANPWQTTAR